MGDVQPKGPDYSDITLERLARRLLNEILGQSITEHQEYGAVLCQNSAGGQFVSTRRRCARENPKGKSDMQVDVGLRERNCGCPVGTKPVAYYHTHPIDTVVSGLDVLHGDPDFSDEDKVVAFDNQLVAFLGSFDGVFRRYDPPEAPTVEVDEHRVTVITDASGKLLTLGPGKLTILNGKLDTGKAVKSSLIPAKTTAGSLRDPKRVILPKK